MKLKLNSEARAILRAIKEEIRGRTVLPESSTLLEKFEPTSDPEEILRRQEYFREKLPLIKEGIGEYIARVKPIRFRREYLHDRVLVVDESEFERASSLGLCEVSTGPVDPSEYPLVLSTVGYGIDVELLPSQIAPELYVLPLWENRETLEALARIGESLGRESVAREILRELAPLKEVMERRRVLESLDELVAEKEKELNEKISKKLESFSLTLTGKDLVSFLSELRAGNYEAIFRHFGEIEGEILELINEAEEGLAKRLGITVELFSREEIYPIRALPERIEALYRELERELKVELYLRSRKILERIAPLLPELRKELESVKELDFLRAVKDFTKGFSFPELWRGGVAFIGGKAPVH